MRWPACLLTATLQLTTWNVWAHTSVMHIRRCWSVSMSLLKDVWCLGVFRCHQTHLAKSNMVLCQCLWKPSQGFQLRICLGVKGKITAVVLFRWARACRSWFGRKMKAGLSISWECAVMRQISWGCKSGSCLGRSEVREGMEPNLCSWEPTASHRHASAPGGIPAN